MFYTTKILILLEIVVNVILYYYAIFPINILCLYGDTLILVYKHYVLALDFTALPDFTVVVRLRVLFLSRIFFNLSLPFPPPPHVTSTLIVLPWSLLRWNFNAFCIALLLLNSAKAHPLDSPLSLSVSSRRSVMGTPLLEKWSMTSSRDASRGRFPRKRMYLFLKDVLAAWVAIDSRFCFDFNGSVVLASRFCLLVDFIADSDSYSDFNGLYDNFIDTVDNFTDSVDDSDSLSDVSPASKHLERGSVSDNNWSLSDDDSCFTQHGCSILTTPPALDLNPFLVCASSVALESLPIVLSLLLLSVWGCSDDLPVLSRFFLSSDFFFFHHL